MPTFEYQLTPLIPDLKHLDKREVEEELRSFFRNLLSHYIAKNFGWSSISSSDSNEVVSIRSTCTEKGCDEIVSSCLSSIYLFENKNGYGNYCFVSIQAPAPSTESLHLFSTIPTVDLHNDGADDEERARDRKTFAADLIGDESYDFYEYEDNGTVYLHASIDSNRRNDIVRRCLSSISLDAKKAYGGEIIFWPDWTKPNEKEKTVAIKERAAALFGSKTVEDPFTKNKSSLFGNSSSIKSPTTFKIVPSRFIDRAITMPPSEPQATASSFAQWVYSLYGNTYGDDEDRSTGKEMEKAILEHRSKTAASVDKNFLRSTGSDWDLIHNGLHLENSGPVNFFEIESLIVNGEHLRASPDLIYRNRSTSDVLVVEIKYSRLPITTNLWPNVWAQLWCYAQLEIALNARNVTVIGEVWGERWTKARGQGRKRVEGQPLLCLRASVRRDPRTTAYDRFFRKLFDIYRGEC